MKPVVIIAIAFVLLVPVSAYGEAYEVIIPSYASTSAAIECTDERPCVVPDELFIQVGDEVSSKYEIRKNIDGEWIYGYGCNKGIGKWFLQDETKDQRDLYGIFNEKGVYEFVCGVAPWKKITVYVNDQRVDTPEDIKKYQEEIKKQQEEVSKISEDEITQMTINNLKLEIEHKDEKINSLINEIDEKNNEILDLKFENRDLKKQIENLKLIVQEQIKVIMEWIRGN